MGIRMQRRTKYLTVCAMLCALGVILLLLGSVIEVLDLSVAAIASLLCIYAVIEMGGFYPWMLWLGTSILSLVLLPIKTPALFYAGFLGYYPILKNFIERKTRGIISWVLKLLSFHLALGLILLVAWAFFPSLLQYEGGTWYAVALYALALICFVMYDVALTRMITVYVVKLQRRFTLK